MFHKLCNIVQSTGMTTFHQFNLFVRIGDAGTITTAELAKPLTDKTSSNEYKSMINCIKRLEKLGLVKMLAGDRTIPSVVLLSDQGKLYLHQMKSLIDGEDVV